MPDLIRSTQDQFSNSFGVQGSQLGSAVVDRAGLVVGGIVDATNTFRRLPIGTSSDGTAVLVDLISSENIVVTVGTINAGTLTNLVSGTINALAAGTITAGTLTNLVSGTINALAAGTITAGTINLINNVYTSTDASANAINTHRFGDTSSWVMPTYPHVFNGATWDRPRVANSANNTAGTGLLGAGILGQDSGGTYHSLAVTTGGSIGTLLTTPTTGTIQNLVTGTINALASGTITGGTLTTISGTPLVAVHTGSGNGLRANSIGAVSSAVWTNALALGDGETNSPYLGYNSDNNQAQSERTYPMNFNGATWDRQRNNNDVGGGTVFASAARTGTTNSTDQTNYNWKGARFFLDITASNGVGPTLDVKIQSKDPVSGTYIDLPGGAFVQKGTTGSDDLTIYPGIAETANETVSDILSRTWRSVAAVTVGTFTFSLGVNYVL